MRNPASRTSNKGATMVEFALVSSIVFFVIFAIFEFGRYMFVVHTIGYAAQEGARAALVGKTAADITTIVRTAAQKAVTSTAVEIYVYPVTAASVPPYADPADWQTRSPTMDIGAGGDYRKLRTRYTFRFATPFIKPLFPSGITVVDASVIYRVEKF